MCSSVIEHCSWSAGLPHSRKTDFFKVGKKSQEILHQVREILNSQGILFFSIQEVFKRVGKGNNVSKMFANEFITASSSTAVCIAKGYVADGQ